MLLDCLFCVCCLSPSAACPALLPFSLISRSPHLPLPPVHLHVMTTLYCEPAKIFTYHQAHTLRLHDAKS